MKMAIVSIQGFERKEEFMIKVILGDNERLVLLVLLVLRTAVSMV